MNRSPDRVWHRVRCRVANGNGSWEGGNRTSTRIRPNEGQPGAGGAAGQLAPVADARRLRHKLIQLVTTNAATTKMETSIDLLRLNACEIYTSDVGEGVVRKFRPAGDVRRNLGGLSEHKLRGRGRQVRDRAAFHGYGRNVVNVSCAGGRIDHCVQSIFPPHAAGLEPADASTPHAGIAATLRFVRNRVLAIVVRDPSSRVRRCSKGMPPDEIIPAKRNCDHPSWATC